MNNEEKWLKSKIESTVEQNASSRLAEVKEKAVRAENVYYEEPAKKRSVWKTSLTAVSCVIIAVTVAALAASPFIFRTPRTENPGDTTAKKVSGSEENEDISISVSTDIDPVEEFCPDEKPNSGEEPYPIDPIEYFNPICFELESICGINLADPSIEDIYVYVCDFPSGEVYKGFSVYSEGNALAVKIGKSNGIFETVYFYIDSEYYLKNILGEDYSVQISSPHVDKITREIELITELMRTSPLVVCKSSASDKTEFSSVEEILEYVGCVIGDMKAEELKFYFENEEAETPHLGVSLGDSVKKEYNTYEFVCNASYADVKSRFEKYRKDADPDGASVFYVPASVLTEDDIDFIADCIVPNMSGILRNEAVDYEFLILNLFACDGQALESLSAKEENGKYYLNVRLYKCVTEFFGNVSICTDYRFAISQDNYNEVKEIIALSDDAKKVDFDIYFSVCSAVKTAYFCEESFVTPPYNYTNTAHTLRDILCGAGGPPISGIQAVVGAEWSNEEPSLLRLKIRYPYGTLADAYIKYDFDKERDSIFFDNTSELDDESVAFIISFIQGAEEIILKPCVPDLSSCGDAKEAMSFLFHYVFQDTAEIDVNFVSLLKLEKGEFFAAVGSESGMVYWLCIGEEVFGILEDKYGYISKSRNIIDSLTLEDVMLISRSYADLNVCSVEINKPSLPENPIDILTEEEQILYVMWKHTGIAFASVENYELYGGTFQIDLRDTDGHFHTYTTGENELPQRLIDAFLANDEDSLADALADVTLVEVSTESFNNFK